MKKGSASTDGVTATIYNAFNGGGSSVASVFISAANFNQTYTDMTFNFSNYSLPSGSYSMVLSSNTASGGSTNYFIKSGNFQITDSVTNAVIINGIGIAATPTTISTLSTSLNANLKETGSGGTLVNGANIESIVLNFTMSEGLLTSGETNTTVIFDIFSDGGLILTGSATINLNNEPEEISEQDLYSNGWESSARDHWGLTTGIYKRFWSPKVKNLSFGVPILKNLQSLD